MKLLLEHFDTLLATPADVEHLNRAILTLAVQGKLAEQDPNDEPVNGVFKRIKNWDDKPFANSAQEVTKPFELRPNWVWRTIGDVCQTTSGGTPSRNNPDYYDGEIPWLKSGELEDTLIEKVEETITEKGLANSSAKIFPAGTPLIALYGATVGKTGLLGLNAATNQAVCALFPVKEIVDTQYLLKYLQSQRQKFLDVSAGGAQPNISQKVIREWLIPLPPLAEQKRIVARVETLFAQTRALAEKLARAESELAGLNRSALAHLLVADSPEAFNKQWDFIAAHFESLLTRPEHVAPLRQSILELAVRGKLTRREAGDESARELLKRIKAERVESGKKEVLAPVKESEKPFALPEGWEWVRLENIVSILGDGLHGTPNYSDDGEYFFVNGNNLSNGKIEIKENTKRVSQTEFDKYKKELNLNTVFVSINGTIGNLAFYNNEKIILGKSACYFNLMDGINKFFIGILIKSPYFLDYARMVASRTTISNVSLKSMRDLMIPLPPLAEQERIVERVEQLLGLCEALESRLRAAQEERSRLVESVLAGQVMSNGQLFENYWRVKSEAVRL